MEYLGLKAANEAGNYEIDNTKKVEKGNFVTTQRKNEMNAFFEDIQFLTRFYGCEIFDNPKETIKPANYHEFHLDMNNIGVHATLHYYPDTDEYYLKAGSRILSKDLSSMPKEVGMMRDEFRNNKKAYQNDGELLILLQDVNVTTKKHSPSGAASFCTATAMQGTTAWIDNNNPNIRKNFPKKKNNMDILEIKKTIQALVEKYKSNRDFYRTSNFNETQVRNEFLDPLFEALGWDIRNISGKKTNEREVLLEESLKSQCRHSFKRNRIIRFDSLGNVSSF